jgi:diguanylate cyclase (GGDEF)-like protein
MCGYLLQIGIDNFKEINERYGQAFGDVVLSDTAQCIRDVVGEQGRVFRMEGDEMIVLVTENVSVEDNSAKGMYKEIRHRVDRHISDGGHHMFYTISAGYVYFDETTADVDKLVEQAGFALHQAKLDGKNMSVCYTQEVYDDYVHTLDVQEELREDIENDFRGFELYYQPVVNIPKKQILGAEALIRWNSTKFGFMSPGQFVPMLEESGLIIPLGRWIAKTALEQCRQWQQLVPGFRINVNLSFVQLKKSDALQDMLNLIRELDIDKNMVMFEVTESGELETGVANQVLRAFKDESIHLAIDDFGTGYSNLRYVKNMTFDLVKIDQSFIRNIRQSQYDYLVVKQFTELAHSLNLTVCYEGVETKEDFECVLELNPDYIQGYYFSKPVPAGVFEEECLNKSLDF